MEEASNGDLIVSVRRTGRAVDLYYIKMLVIHFLKLSRAQDPDGCQASLLAAGEKEEYSISNPDSEASKEQEDRVNGVLN